MCESFHVMSTVSVSNGHYINNDLIRELVKKKRHKNEFTTTQF